MRLRMNYCHNGLTHCHLTMKERGDSVELLDSKGTHICNVTNGIDLFIILESLSKSGVYKKGDNQ